MSAGYKDFTAGAVLTAADLEDYNQNQSIMRFASAAARDTALSVVKTEGMMAYLVDLNVVTVYSGAAWSTIGPVHGAWTAWTPTVTQSVSVTVTNNNSRYQRIGRTITGMFYVTVTGAGTAANNVIIGGLPFASAMSSAFLYGVAEIFDTSASNEYAGLIVLASTTSFAIRPTGSTGAGSVFGSAVFTAGLASGDTLAGTFTYEAAADA